MTAGFTIRRALPEDHAAVARELADPAGEVVGTAAVRLLEPGLGELKRMWLRPSRQGRGLGRRLMDACLDEARRLGCRALRLDTQAKLEAAVHRYRAYGFSEIPRYHDNHRADIWMERSLRVFWPRRHESSGRGAVRAAVLALALVALCAGPARAALAPGDHRIALEHGGRQRSYIVHVPPASREGRPLPVILSFHGGGGNAEGQQKYSRMDALADAEGFLAVYPDGTGRMSDRLLTWNAGTCCAYSVANNVDDVGFTLALLADLEARQPVDRRRVYATGLSNGAMMAWRLAVEASGRIAAIAPVAGAKVLKAGGPARPVPVMHFHSVDDPRALYAGGLGPPFPMTTSQVFHSAVEPTVRDWAAGIGCPVEPRIASDLKGQPGSKEAGHTATRYVWAPCRAGSEVVLWKLTGTGHVWPGGLQDYLPGLLGPSTALVDANLEMWRFFQRFTLDAVPAK